MRGTPMERSQTVNLASRAIMSIVVCAWLFSTTIACQNATHQLHESDCEKIDPRLEGPDLLDRFEAERIKGKQYLILTCIPQVCLYGSFK